MKTLFLALSLSIVAQASPALTQTAPTVPGTGVFKTGKAVYDLCTSKQQGDIDVCEWFIMGGHDMMKFYGDVGLGGDKICIPTGTTARSLRQVLINFWREKPERLNSSASSAIYIALRDKYPCN